MWWPGAHAIVGPAAVPEHQGPPPGNPFNPRVPLELCRLVGPDGNAVAAWLSGQSLEVTGQQRPIAMVLPMTAEVAAQVWHGAVAQAQPGPRPHA